MPLSLFKKHSSIRSASTDDRISPVKKIRRRLFTYAVVLLILLGAGLLWTTLRLPKKEHEKLLQLSRDLITFELTDNSLSLHYTMADPEAFALKSCCGLDSEQISLPVYQENTVAETEAAYASFMSRLSEIDTRRLSPHDVWVYRIIEDSLNSSLSELTMPFYGEPLSPSSGEQTSLLILFAEYRIASRADVESYLATLSCVGSYFDGLLLYEQQKAEQGLFMSDAAVKKVIEQCDTLCTKEQLAQGSHFLQTTLRSRLDALQNAGGCTAAEREQYLARNDAILSEIVAPAYTRLADGLFLLKGSGRNDQGLCHFENGARYYEARIASLTGSSRTPEEILSLLTEQFAADYDALYETAAALSEMLPDQMQALMSVPELLAGYTPEEMLTDLQTRMAADFPEVSDPVFYEVKPVDDALCPYTSPAFYMIPAVDAYQDNRIYINYGNEPDALTLYTTLAHEGYPGHLYQNIFHLSGMNEDSIMPLEGILSYGGYAEGWATYVEDLSYTYAAQLMSSQSSARKETSAIFPSEEPSADSLPEEAPEIFPSEEASVSSFSEETRAVPLSGETLYLLCDFYRIDRRIQLCLYSMLDVSIHYYGMTREEAQTLLRAYGISDTDVINSIYEYIVEEPVNYLKYYLGYLEIVSLKEDAKEAWGSAYSDMRFHTMFLSLGPAPFSLLREAILQNTPESSHAYASVLISVP